MPDRSDEPATQAAGDLSPVPGKGPARPELTGAHQGWLDGFFKPVIRAYLHGAAEHYPVFRIEYEGHADTRRGWGK